MYTRAVPYDKEIIFYFDRFGNKYVARGGSLAWRTNNPGLVHSHALTSGRSIGACDQIAIFSSPSEGEKAPYNWLKRKKYYHSNLHEIAKHYAPNDPKSYVESLTSLTHLRNDKPLSSFSKVEFQTLVRGIKHLAGYSSTGNEEFRLLPKITARFCSKNAEIYLVGDDQFLSKSEALEWVSTHQLDAVLVHKSDGTLYLRSRPGHHFKKLTLNEGEYGKDIEFNEIVRETGTEKKGQCIWGFINGVSNQPKDVENSMTLISSAINHQQVWSLINDQKILGFGDISACISQKLSIQTPIIRLATQFLRFLINLSEKNSEPVPVVLIAHSQGALISSLAIENLTHEERQKIHIFTFGGASFIPPNKAHPNSHNYISLNDPIPRLASSNSSYLLLLKHETAQKGQAEDDIIWDLVSSDVDFYLDTQNINTIEEFRKQRTNHYREVFRNLTNVTVLTQHNSESWEHSFAIPCYQTQLRKILDSYQNGKHDE